MSESRPTAASAEDRLDRDAAEAAVDVAVRAPSIHNTQPWRWVFDGEALTLLADRSRQLRVADPSGHSLLISCGAAVLLTELGLRAAGWRVESVLFPDPDDKEVLARFRAVGRQEPDEEVHAQVEAALRRQSDRRPFSPEPVSDEEMEKLRDATRGEGVYVDFPTRPDQQLDLAVAVSWADREERRDQAYIDEMNQWLRDPDVNATSDGLPLDAVPHVSADHPRHTDVPVRDFEVGVSGRLLIDRDVDERPLIGVVFTDSDMPIDQLRSGGGMMRLMIEAELLGLTSCPLSQAVDLTAFRGRVQDLMGWTDYPQMMLRIGHPTETTQAAPRTPRRATTDVLQVQIDQ
jgi:Nitroreductase family